MKIGVFYDGNYFLHVSNYYNYFHEMRQRVSLPGFHSLIRHVVSQVEEVDVNLCRITEAHYFRGRLSALEASQRGNLLYNDRVFDDVLMSAGIVSHFLPLRTRGGKKEEKGIDVWLALEAYELSLCEQFDVLVLISADGEYAPLIRKLNALGVKTMVFNWEFDYTDVMGRKVVTRTSQDLLQEVVYPIAAHELFEQSIASGEGWASELFLPHEGSLSREEELHAEMGYAYEHLPGDAREDEEGRQSGHIINILPSKGYGFIKHLPNNIFFYHEDVESPAFGDLSVGDLVSYTLGSNSDGQDVARRVRRERAAR